MVIPEIRSLLLQISNIILIHPVLFALKQFSYAFVIIKYNSYIMGLTLYNHTDYKRSKIKAK